MDEFTSIALAGVVITIMLFVLSNIFKTMKVVSQESMKKKIVEYYKQILALKPEIQKIAVAKNKKEAMKSFQDVANFLLGNLMIKEEIEEIQKVIPESENLIRDFLSKLLRSKTDLEMIAFFGFSNSTDQDVFQIPVFENIQNTAKRLILMTSEMELLVKLPDSSVHFLNEGWNLN